MTIARHVVTVGGATLLSRLLGFARDIVIAAIFGTGIRADAFFVAFQLANVARRLLAEGALNAALVPLYLRARDAGGSAAAAAFAGRLIGTLTVALLVGAVLLNAAMPAVMLVLAPGFADDQARLAIAVDMARLMLPFLVFAGPVAVLMGVLNAGRRFAAAAHAAVLFNLVLIAALLLVLAAGLGDSEKSGRLLAVAVGLAGGAQLLLVGGAVFFGGIRITPLALAFSPDMRRFLHLAVPGLIAAGIPQISIIAGTIIASVSPGAVSWIYYANRLIELPLGIAGIAIGTVLVPAFSDAVRSGDQKSLVEAESRGLELSLGLALPAAIALFVLAEPIVHVLFERGAFTNADTAATAAALAAFALGLPGHVLVKALAPAFFAREDTATPMMAALIGIAVVIGGSLALLAPFGHVGIALAIALAGWLNAGLLGVLLARRFGFALDGEARRRLPRIALAAVAMGVTVSAARGLAASWLDGAAPLMPALALAAIVALGLVSYGALLRVFGVVRLIDLAATLRPKA
jgi:putative peptidoglycan lipid II flippase